MEFSDYLVMCPAPAPIGRGERRQLSLAVSPSEYEAITHLAYNPELRSMYDGKVQEVVRHALDYYVQEMTEVVEEKYRPLFDRVRDETQKARHLGSKQALTEWLDAKTDRLEMLYDCGEFEEMFEGYAGMLKFIHDLPRAWRNILYGAKDEHLEFVAWWKRVNNLSLETAIRMEDIEREFEQDVY